MALDVLVTTDRISSDPLGRSLIDHLQSSSVSLGIDDGALYYDFPTYADYETVSHKPDVLLVTRYHGIIAVRFMSGTDMSPLSSAEIEPVDESLGQFCSILIGRLLKSKVLRRSLSQLKFNVTPVLYRPGGAPFSTDLEHSKPLFSLEGLDQLILGLRSDAVENDALAEIRSVVEGAKALTRPQKRAIANPASQQIAASLSQLEAEIANFDQKQRRAALVSVPGAQRIRGLAGSGKTVILAMKAAHLHLTRPNERILVTFFTRSLRASIKSLVTRFYRHYKEEDPDWAKIHIRHGWGGASSAGTYADACRSHSIKPLSFREASAGAAGKTDPFDYACRDLLRKTHIQSQYDHILIDEGQDFPGGFYELCYGLARGRRDDKSIVWAYDELQNILNVEMRSPEQLFGEDVDGSPRVSLDRTASRAPPGSTNDTVLSKCYRNQREVLLTAHALGFGIYSNIVQLLESREHWHDVGYDVSSGSDFRVGERVKIIRPPENSPVSLSTSNAGNTISWFEAPDMAKEIEWVISGVDTFLKGGLHPEDIIVIALDDQNARSYLMEISKALATSGVQSNNIIADPYSEPPFTIPGKVTLSTVYRAKGNEAAVVFAIGVDAVQRRTRSGRNKLFTAFTRTKAWLRVSGIGKSARAIGEEIDAAMAHFPALEFTMPDLARVDLIQRDLSERQLKAKRIRDDFLSKLKREGYSEDEIIDLLNVEIKNG